jgi:hypothetical protein
MLLTVTLSLVMGLDVLSTCSYCRITQGLCLYSLNVFWPHPS